MSTRVAFLDYHCANYHADVFLSAIREHLADRVQLAGVHAIDGESAKAWGQKNNVAVFDDVRDLNPLVDGWLVLAPSNCEYHLELASRVIPFGKPVYVDKTFAPDYKTAAAIFELADRHNAPLQSYSVLRDTNIQEIAATLCGPVQHVLAWAPAGKLLEYLVHPLEVAISLLGPDVQRVMRRGTDTTHQLLLDFAGGRTAVVNIHPGHQVPYAAIVSTDKETRYIEAETTAMWTNTLRRTVDFIDAKKPNIDRNETLAIMKIIDAFQNPAAREGFVTI